MSFELHSYSLRVRFSSRGDLASSKHGDLTDLGEQIGRAWLLDEYTMKIHVGDPRAYSRFDGFQLLTFGLFLAF
jgi:hypothetical protein